ncbi:MAG: NAD-dependent epimerase/dehydratase family protein [Liquorilactobacillus hordei]|uniref:NAD-dependent epimerase/dehydratase family protein n=1 Tax=Liquorilactobacillus hordei TaxID=468911 RepID=UPI0039E99C3E
MRYSSKCYIEDLEQAIGNSLGLSSLEGKSILVTGATGTIGSFIVDELLTYNQRHTNKIKIFATSRKLAHLEECFNDFKTPQLNYVEYDNLKPINFDFEVEYIIHNAGNSFPQAFKNDPIGTIMGNIKGTYNLLNYALTHGVKRFLYVSSGEIYGEETLDKGKFTERHTGHINPMSVRSCYPNSKRMCETLCSSFYVKNHLDTVVVRPCHTYGPLLTESDDRAHVQFIRNVLNGQKVLLKGQGLQLRSYCYVADCAAGILTALFKGKTNNAYNIANKNSIITIHDLAQLIADEGNSYVELKKMPKDENDSPIQKQVLDGMKLEELGWSGKYDIKKGIKHVLEILK